MTEINETFTDYNDDFDIQSYSNKKSATNLRNNKNVIILSESESDYFIQKPQTRLQTKTKSVQKIKSTSRSQSPQSAVSINGIEKKNNFLRKSRSITPSLENSVKGLTNSMLKKSKSQSTQTENNFYELLMTAKNNEHLKKNPLKSKIDTDKNMPKEMSMFLPSILNLKTVSTGRSKVVSEDEDDNHFEIVPTKRNLSGIKKNQILILKDSEEDMKPSAQSKKKQEQLGRKNSKRRTNRKTINTDSFDAINIRIGKKALQEDESDYEPENELIIDHQIDIKNPLVFKSNYPKKQTIDDKKAQKINSKLSENNNRPIRHTRSVSKSKNIEKETYNEEKPKPKRVSKKSANTKNTSLFSQNNQIVTRDFISSPEKSYVVKKESKKLDKKQNKTIAGSDKVTEPKHPIVRRSRTMPNSKTKEVVNAGNKKPQKRAASKMVKGSDVTNKQTITRKTRSISNSKKKTQPSSKPKNIIKMATKPKKIDQKTISASESNSGTEIKRRSASEKKETVRNPTNSKLSSESYKGKKPVILKKAKSDSSLETTELIFDEKQENPKRGRKSEVLNIGSGNISKNTPPIKKRKSRSTTNSKTKTKEITDSGEFKRSARISAALKKKELNNKKEIMERSTSNSENIINDLVNNEKSTPKNRLQKQHVSKLGEFANVIPKSVPYRKLPVRKSKMQDKSNYNAEMIGSNGPSALAQEVHEKKEIKKRTGKNYFIENSEEEMSENEIAPKNEKVGLSNHSKSNSRITDKSEYDKYLVRHK